jgi:hypothetical protein
MPHAKKCHGLHAREYECEDGVHLLYKQEADGDNSARLPGAILTTHKGESVSRPVSANCAFHSGETSMKKWITTASMIVLLGATSFAVAADNPFAGTWKVNKDKSKMVGDVVRFAPAADGAVRTTQGAVSYTFKPDGSETTTPYGAAAWKKIDDNTWQEIDKVKGNEVADSTWKLSADGKTLEVESKGKKANGDSFDVTATYTRMAGTKGFMGAWKSTKVNVSAPNTFEIKANDDGTMTYSLVEEKATFTSKMDGKGVKGEGPTVPDSVMLATLKTGPRSFRMTEHMGGKLVYTGNFTVAPDGKTMTETSTPIGSTETETVLYDKQ